MLIALVVLNAGWEGRSLQPASEVQEFRSSLVEGKEEGSIMRLTWAQVLVMPFFGWMTTGPSSVCEME